MHLLTFITAAVLLGCALGQNQSSDTPNNRLADQEVKLQAQFNTTYYIAVAHAPPIPQLYISDEEARGKLLDRICVVRCDVMVCGVYVCKCTYNCACKCA